MWPKLLALRPDGLVVVVLLRAERKLGYRADYHQRGWLVLGVGPSLGVMGFAPGQWMIHSRHLSSSIRLTAATPERSRSAPVLSTKGAYGLRFHGLESERLLVAMGQGGQWPLVTIDCRQIEEAEAGDRIRAARADVELVDGERALIERTGRRATLLARSAPDDGRLVHPFLTTVGTIFAWWHGHDAFHGGAFLTDAGAWVLLGERGAGKSSMLAALHLADHPVLADDLVVITDGVAFAGPRCIDLRPDAAEILGVGDLAEPVRGGERLRLVQPDIKPQVPLCGWVVLSWSKRVETRALTPGQRLQHLAAHSSIPPGHPTSLVRLAGLPGYELSRPRSRDSFEPAVDRLLGLCA